MNVSRCCTTSCVNSSALAFDQSQSNYSFTVIANDTSDNNQHRSIVIFRFMVFAIKENIRYSVGRCIWYMTWQVSSPHQSLLIFQRNRRAMIVRSTMISNRSTRARLSRDIPPLLTTKQFLVAWCRLTTQFLIFKMWAGMVWEIWSDYWLIADSLRIVRNCVESLQIIYQNQEIFVDESVWLTLRISPTTDLSSSQLNTKIVTCASTRVKCKQSVDSATQFITP